MSILANNEGYIGIDIGSAGVKMVEIKKGPNGPRLVTYGFSELARFKSGEAWQKDEARLTHTIEKIWQEAGFQSRNGIASLPAFSVFSSIINLSNVPADSLASAVYWEAKKVIPLPLEEMTIDWNELGVGAAAANSGATRNVKIFLTGAPNEIIERYKRVFLAAKINLLNLETETFSLIRSLIGVDQSVIALVAMGASSTNITIVENGIPMLNRSLDFGAAAVTEALARALKISWTEAEQFKYDYGLDSFAGTDHAVSVLIKNLVSPVVNEIKFALNLFQNKNQKKADKIILTGGSALLPNFQYYLADLLDRQVIIGNPWNRVDCPAELMPVLEEIGPRLAAAVGLALREVL